MAKKKRVLIISDSPNQTTGYGQVMRNVARTINEDHEVSFIGLQHFGLPIWYVGATDKLPEKPFKMYPRNGDNHYGFDSIGGYLKRIRPDVLITLCDIGLNNGYIKPIKEAEWNGKWIAYCAYDTPTWHPTFHTAAATPDVVVAMSKFGKKVIEEHSGIEAKYIPHGVDTEVFKPLDKEAIKKDSELPKFVVGAAGRNQVRKMWSKTVEGFAKFAKGKDDVMMLLHCEPFPEVDSGPVSLAAEAGWSIPDLVVKHKLEKKFKFTVANMDVLARYNLLPQVMNVYYNMMDVFGFLTGGEGFGLPSLESQAAGSTLVTTDFSTGPELTEGHGDVVPIKDTWTASSGIEWGLADTDKYADILNGLYADPAKLKEKQAKAREFALGYDWNKVVCPMWRDLLNEV